MKADIFFPHSKQEQLISFAVWNAENLEKSILGHFLENISIWCRDVYQSNLGIDLFCLLLCCVLRGFISICKKPYTNKQQYINQDRIFYKALKTQSKSALPLKWELTGQCNCIVQRQTQFLVSLFCSPSLSLSFSLHSSVPLPWRGLHFRQSLPSQSKEGLGYYIQGHIYPFMLN